MDLFAVVAERARERRRIVVVDEQCRIAYAQHGSPMDDRVFHFSAESRRLPLELEQLVKSAIAAWNADELARGDMRLDYVNGIAVRVFPMLEHGARQIGIMLEQPRRRCADA